MGFEPTNDGCFEHPAYANSATEAECAQRDLNPHSHREAGLKPAASSVPPWAHKRYFLSCKSHNRHKIPMANLLLFTLSNLQEREANPQSLDISQVQRTASPQALIIILWRHLYSSHRFFLHFPAEYIGEARSGIRTHPLCLEGKCAIH